MLYLGKVRIRGHLVHKVSLCETVCRVFGFTEVKRFDRGDDNLTAGL